MCASWNAISACSVTLAREVMTRTEHTMLVGPGARAFADEMGHARLTADDLVTPEARAEFERYRAGTFDRPVSDLFNA